MHQVIIGNWGLEVEVGSLPPSYDWHAENALFIDEIDLKSRHGQPLFVAVHDLANPAREDWKPSLVIALTYEPCEACFNPGFLIVPDTKRLFIGAGVRLLAYDLGAPARLWEDDTELGFFRWGRYQSFVWMAAELEFAVWSDTGEKLWTSFVEPPWEYAFSQGNVELDVMGVKRLLRMADGQLVE